MIYNPEEFKQQLHSLIQANDPKEAFYALVGLYSSSTDEQRILIRDQWPFGRQWDVPEHHKLSWNIPGERSPSERIWAALIYQSILCHGADLRDHLINLGWIYNNAVLAKLSVQQLFVEAAALSEPSCADLMLSLLKPETDTSLNRFGLAAIDTEEGVMLVFLSDMDINAID